MIKEEQDSLLLSGANASAEVHSIKKSSPSPVQNLNDDMEGKNVQDVNTEELRQQESLSPASSTASIHDTNFLNDRVRCLESEKLALMIDHNNLIREFNKRMESHLEEIRNLKEANQHIEQESNELRDLCCFLDDDRQKCRKLAKEWQRFGKHTVAVMRNEVMSYQEKLRALETRQSELIKENRELRDLCVYLDSQRTGNLHNESAETMLKYSLCKKCSSLQKNNTHEENGVEVQTTENGDHASEHITRLQNQIVQLENEKESLHKLLMYGGKSRKEKKRVSFSFPSEDDYDSSSTTSEVDRLDFPPIFGDDGLTPGILRNMGMVIPKTKNQFSDISPRNNDISRITEGVSEEQLEEIRGKLNKSRVGEATLSEDEISLLKNMCNVVTEKLRSDSNTSFASANNSFDLNSPLSPPPSTVGIHLYNNGGNRSKSEQVAAVENITPSSDAVHRPPLPGYEDSVKRRTEDGLS
ncbi:coiled-coil domain-containing protein 85C-A-like [Hydractinia symbiolongicarpus]|uniref:coiled-coil domain-containing protein 85C-A-like n=1 Tax=Hydractinia symbiolongicarpus TaxID=13093 RepID=UPI00254B435C|nr:coiled-coil domain-containing protein 85C-A-like [Hydractinia symbiolongicarpus]